MKKSIYPALLLIIFLVHVFVNYQVLSNSRVGRINDEHLRIMTGLYGYEMLFRNPDFNIPEAFNFFTSLFHIQSHPHFYEFILSLSFGASDALHLKSDNLAILLSNSLFLFILLFSVYGIGRITYDPKTGLLSAFLVSLFPYIFSHQRVAMLDFPLASMVTLTLLVFLKTNKFNSLLYSILAGIAFGLAQITKETAIIFIFAPVFYYFYISYREGAKKYIVMRNFCIMLLFFIVVSGMVYLKPSNFYAFQIYFGKTFHIPNHPGYLFYVKGVGHLIGIVVLILSLPVFLNYLVNIRNRDKFISFWLVIPFILFSLSANKTYRFILPVLPALGLIIAKEALSVKLARFIKKPYIYIFVLSALLQFVFMNTGLMGNFNDSDLEAGIIKGKIDNRLKTTKSLYKVFQQESANNIADKAIPLFRRPDKYVRLKDRVFIYNLPIEVPDSVNKVLLLFYDSLIRDQLQYNFLYNGLPFIIFCPMGIDNVDMPLLGYEQINWRKVILESDYIIDNNCSNLNVDQMSEFLKSEFKSQKPKFRAIAEENVYSDCAVIIYKRVSN